MHHLENVTALTPICGSDDQSDNRGNVVVPLDGDALQSDPRLLAALVSHDLREPINAIQSFLSIVVSERTGSLNALQFEFLRSAETSTRHLARRVNDVQMALVGTDALNLDLGEVDIHERIAACCQELAWAQERCSVTLRTQLERSEDRALCWGDSDLIDQVLLNLVENAIKYAPVNGEVWIKTHRDENGSWEVIVENAAATESGNDPTTWFESYRRASQERDLAPPGLGLGLTIARLLVRAHGGRLWAKADTGIVTFGFTLPCPRGCS